MVSLKWKFLLFVLASLLAGCAQWSRHADMGCSHFLVTCPCSTVTPCSPFKNASQYWSRQLVFHYEPTECGLSQWCMQRDICNWYGPKPRHINTRLQFTISRSPSAWPLPEDKHEVRPWNNDDKTAISDTFFLLLECCAGRLGLM